MMRHSAPMLAALAVACGGSSVTPDPGESLVTPPAGELSLRLDNATARPGATLSFRFINRSVHQAVTGDLGCVNYHERREGDTWRAIHPLRLCTEIAHSLAAGEERRYATPAPDQPGTYRLVVEAYVGAPADKVVVRSGELVVR